MGQSCCDSKAKDLARLRGKQKTVLLAVMIINFAMFGIEFIAGTLAKSSALQADSLDMLGDAIVYGFSLFVLHRSQIWKARAALLKGLIIVGFAIFVLINTIAKIIAGSIPTAETMGVFGVAALLANLTCLLLLMRHRNDDINMRSTFICSRNDIISNTGVIAAAFLVGALRSMWPDIIIGFTIAALILKSAWPILKESAGTLRVAEIDMTKISS